VHATTLTLQQLNRATLARQMLLVREKVSAADAAERLCGMQAQEAKPPFAGLWTRVEGFRREELNAALQDRQVVRATLMRMTLHLMSARDYAALRAALEPLMARGFRPLTKDLDLDKVLPAARALLEEEPRTFNELRALLARTFPDANERALGAAVRVGVPLVMVATDDRWGFPRDARFALAEEWLGGPLSHDDAAAQLVLRYLAAFGPASAADFQRWSGLRGVKSVFDGLREQLETFEDERGRELFDLPDAPRPDGETAAPLRLLPEFDNLVLAHDDRTRVIADEHRALVATKNLRIRATFLVDGFVRGTWSVERRGKKATLKIAPFERLKEREAGGLKDEGDALLRFLEEDAATFDVVVG
jgi:Winged helix DNA-binding domain